MTTLVRAGRFRCDATCHNAGGKRCALGLLAGLEVRLPPGAGAASIHLPAILPAQEENPLSFDHYVTVTIRWNGPPDEVELVGAEGQPRIVDARVAPWITSDEATPNPTPSQLAALNAFRAPRMSTEDLELNIRGTILDAIVNTAQITGLHAGEAAELLLEEVYKTLFMKRRRWTMELALRLGEEEVLQLQELLQRAQDAARPEFPEPAP